MSRLLHDRYYAYGPSHAWDLATGESVRVDEIVVDDQAEAPPPASLVEALEHGREGEPRWIVADTGKGLRFAIVARRLAMAARARGYVPIAADVYLRLRDVLDADLSQRTLLLIDSRHGLKEPDREMMKMLDEAAVSYQIVLTKADKPKPPELERVRAAVTEEAARHVAAHPELAVTSAAAGLGIEELRAGLAGFAAGAE